MSAFEPTAWSYHRNLTRIDEISVKDLRPALQEFFRLAAILRQRAIDTKNTHLSEFVDTAQKELNIEREKMNDTLYKLGDIELAIRPATFDEMEARLKYADDLAELTTRKMELHLTFIREQAARLKAKLEELDTGSGGGARGPNGQL